MTVKVPEFEEPGLTEFLTRMLEERDRVRKDLVSSASANHSILLISPSKKVFEITVDDAGVIQRTLVSG